MGDGADSDGRLAVVGVPLHRLAGCAALHRGVMWNVMRRAMTDSKVHLDEFVRHDPHNARELQPLGDRKIL